MFSFFLNQPVHCPKIDLSLFANKTKSKKGRAVSRKIVIDVLKSRFDRFIRSVTFEALSVSVLQKSALLFNSSFIL